MSLHLSRQMQDLLGRRARHPAIQPAQLGGGKRRGRIDEFGVYRSPNIADAMFNSTEMALIAANFGGGVQGEVAPYQVGGKERVAIGSFTYAAQASGSQLWMTRLTIPCRITGVTIITDTSTGSATLAVGDRNTAALIAAAAAYTSTDTPTRIGKTSAHLSALTAGYDAVTGNQVTYANNYGYGALYDDIIITTAAASLPASGNLVLIIEYVID